MTGDIIDDVVDENDVFQVSPKIQQKMQNRHNLMLNIQNITKIIGDHEVAVNRYSAILNSLEESKEKPHYRILGDFMIPVLDGAEATTEINSHVDKLAQDLDKHINQVKSMQKQFDALGPEIDKMMEIEKGIFEAGKKNNPKKKIKRR